MKKILHLYIFLLLISSFEVHSQISQIEPIRDTMELKPMYGLVGGYSINFHITDFRNLPGVPSCCPKFSNGQGGGYYFGGLIEYPFNYEMLISTRLAFSHFNGKLKSYEETPILLDGKESIGEFEHFVDANFSQISLEPLFIYKPIDNLYAMGGISLGLLTQADYYQIEKITKPTDRGTFLDGRSYRNQNQGSMIDDANKLQFGIKIGAGYRLPFNKKQTLFAFPEFFYSYYPTNLVQERGWKVHQLSVGVGIKYRVPPPPPPPPAPPIPPPDPELPLTTKVPYFAADIDVVEIDTNNRENKNFTIKVEDFVSYNMRPLLAYVFFEENSSELPSRYVQFDETIAANFSIDQLGNLNALETYYYVLNIIGKRLKEIPTANITLIGTNSDIGVEKNNKQLSENRAKAVANYFITTWKIDPNRIKITSRNLPKENSKIDDPLGMQENRRVEIIPDDIAIIEPVFTVDTMRVMSSSELRFVPKVISEAGISKYSFLLKHKDIELLKVEDSGKIPNNFSWKITNKNFPKDEADLSYSLFVVDSVGQTISTPVKRIPISRKSIDMKRRTGQSDKEFEYYSLILFDYGKSELGSEHRKVVDFIKQRISQDSKVFIYGFTDSMGDENINRRISDNRAISVLKRLNINSNVTVEGKGESELLYDNDTPEGRFYCRTVTINIETPVKPY